MSIDTTTPTLLATLLQQEQDLQFLTFDSTLALDLGLLLIKNANIKTPLHPVVISITLNNQLLFHYAMPGTAPIDTEAVRRKASIVERFCHSSYYVGQLFKSQGNNGITTISNIASLSSTTTQIAAATSLSFDESGLLKEYTGGAFPLMVKGIGVVGSIAASRLTGNNEDHELVVSSLKEFLGMEKEGKNKVE
ncbi:3876_t:CDS:1 [Ambispora leptoticha]|uniref:3876_t:CDS:1 n=1 Tax=Ambispora leptoticha TaxID=144679 RepID=A0A9N9HXK4_9GLOM|nr:3876_t:CDS:1 [Ambispora leptoticha]